MTISDPLIAKRALPVLVNLRRLLIRQSDGGLRDFVRSMNARVDSINAAKKKFASPTLQAVDGSGALASVDSVSSRPKAPTGEVILECGGNSVLTQPRLSPDDFRALLLAVGVVLAPADLAALLAAFKDAVGYLLLRPFVAALLDTLSPAQRAAVSGGWAAALRRHKDAAGGAAATATAAAVLATQTGGRRRPNNSGGDADSIPFAALRTLVLLPAGTARRAAFDAAWADESAVCTASDFAAYYAGLVLVDDAARDDAFFADLVQQSWGVTAADLAPPARAAAAAAAAPASGTAVAAKSGGAASPPRGGSRFSGPIANQEADLGATGPLGSVGAARTWREAAVAEGYEVTPHVSGYRGHLPTAFERFGESFHRVDAGVHALLETQRAERTAAAEAALADALASGTLPPPNVQPLNRQGNRANAHNFRFA